MGLVRRAFALALAAPFVFGAQSALASPSAKLVYVRGPGAEACPAEADLRKAVATRIGYDPFFPTAQKTVVAQVTRTAGGYHGKVQIVGDEGTLRGERDLSSKGDDCAEIVSAMALAVSIALDDLDEAAPSTPTPSTVAPPPPPPPPPEVPRIVAPPPPPPPRPPPRGPHVQLGASAGPTLSLGTAPAPAVGGSVAATLGYGIFDARLGLRGDLPSSESIVPAGLVSTSTVLGTLSGCVHAKLPFVCVGGGLGSIASTTERITRPASDRGRLVVLGASAGADISLGRVLYLEPFLEGALNLSPVRVEVDGSTVFFLSTVTATIGLHLGGHFL